MPKSVPEKRKVDLLSQRLADIILLLYKGETVTLKGLAERYHASERTIRRDLEERLCFLEMSKDNKPGFYSLAKKSLLKSDYSDIEQFIEGIGGKELFPDFNKKLLKEFLSKYHAKDKAIKIYGHSYIKGFEHTKSFKELYQSIEERRIIKISYQKGETLKDYTVDPYRLVNYKGVWYLIALKDAVIKTFTLSKIEKINATFEYYKFNEQVSEVIEENGGIYFSAQQITVQLLVSSVVAEYFERRQLIAGQKNIGRNEQGDLRVDVYMNNEKQLLPIVQYWMPHIQIIDPQSLNQKVKRNIEEWLKKQTQN